MSIEGTETPPTRSPWTLSGELEWTVPDKDDDGNKPSHYAMSTDKTRIDLAALDDAFGSDLVWWAKRLPDDELKTMVEQSFCVGLYWVRDDREETMVGFARLVTDYVTIAYLTDVYVLGEHQGKGLATYMMTAIRKMLDGVNCLRRCVLITGDPRAVDFYRKTLGAAPITENIDVDCNKSGRSSPTTWTIPKERMSTETSTDDDDDDDYDALLLSQFLGNKISPSSPTTGTTPKERISTETATDIDVDIDNHDVEYHHTLGKVLFQVAAEVPGSESDDSSPKVKPACAAPAALDADAASATSAENVDDGIDAVILSNAWGSRPLTADEKTVVRYLAPALGLSPPLLWMVAALAICHCEHEHGNDFDTLEDVMKVIAKRLKIFEKSGMVASQDIEAAHEPKTLAEMRRVYKKELDAFSLWTQLF
ncbi:hypothetical protein B0H66DRAFT_625112 [Apodospora peruviana]|uniref:N-acetyltransferase domain-containing protein n=1 Tax=Apodospora peruviana TaxID=516989 RepID=A0AAE0I0C9_9PEZI|nr:hypothetical protein B0H66DRAFT_625112 [Apodospora peruviana]